MNITSLIQLSKCNNNVNKMSAHWFHSTKPTFLDEIEKAFRKRNYNPRDQFGTLSRDNSVPQVEKLEKGFENPWLKTIKGEDLLEREIKFARKKWEFNANKFENAPQITIPFRAAQKINKQKRKEFKEYQKALQKQ